MGWWGGGGGGSLLYWYCIDILCSSRKYPYSPTEKGGVSGFRAAINFRTFKVALNPH